MHNDPPPWLFEGENILSQFPVTQSIFTKITGITFLLVIHALGK